MRATIKALRNELVLLSVVVSTFAQPAFGQSAGRVIAWGSNTYGQTNAPAATDVIAIAAGSAHSLALRSDGSVLAWGDNSSGQTNVPASATNVIAIASGGNHSLALRSDGTPVAWGANENGQSTVPPQATNVVAVAAGITHSLALRADGTVVAWGSSNSIYGQATVPPGLRDVVGISAGWLHSLALRSDGTVVSWGLETCAASQLAPFLNTEVAAMAGGAEFSAFLDRAGNAIVRGCFGMELTNATPGFSNLVSIAAGPNYCLGLRNDGLVVGWEQQGSTFRLPPPGTTNIIAVAAGDSHSLALQSDGNCFITEQPPNRQIVGGMALRLTGFVVGQPPINYQWQFNGAALPGATNFDLVINAAQWTTSGVFSLTASNVTGSVTSRPAAVTISPTVTTAPSNLSLSIGSSAAFSVAAFGAPPLTYRWQKGLFTLTDGGRISGAGTPTLTISNVNLADAGLYRAVITDTNGAQTAMNVFLRVGNPTIAAWGNNTNGQTYVPYPINNSLQVAAADKYSLALRRDGSAITWGDAALTNLPPDLPYSVALASGLSDIVALGSNGSLSWWHAGSSLQSTPPPETALVDIACGESHYLALRADGSVVAWGDNSYGQAVPPPNLTNGVAVAGGRGHSLALLRDGTILAWGNSSYGLTNVPAAATNTVAIAAGADHSLALKADGSIVAWGLNDAGQTNIPPGLTNVAAIAAGAKHSLALTADGHVWVWGSDDSGQTNIPAGLTNVISLSSRSRHILALVGDSAPCISTQPANIATVVGMAVRLQVAASGTALNFQWQFNGTNVSGGTNAALFFPAVHLADDGQYQVLVSNGFGSITSTVVLLDASILAEWGSTISLPPPKLTNVTAIAASAWGDYFLAVTGGIVVGWGDNSRGQLNLPPGLSNVVAISAGRYHNLALLADGTVTAWGETSFGATDVPPGLSNVIAVAAGGAINVDEASFSLALKSDGTVVGWGSIAPIYSVPTVPPGLSNVVAIAAGNNFALAAHSDGSVTAWGDNETGQTSVPIGLFNVVQVAAGGWFGMALRNDGRVFAWGFGPYGQTAVPADLSNAVSIAAGYYQGLALRQDGSVFGWGGYDSGAAYPPAGLTQVVAIASAQSYSLALVSDRLPYLTLPPLSQSVLAGGAVSFTAFGAGPGPIAYQWQFNGTNITGATNAVLTLPNAAVTNAGSYRCVLSNSSGSITSSPAALTVTREPLRFDPAFLTLSPTNGFSFRLLGLAGAGPIIIWGSSNSMVWTPLFTNRPAIGLLDLHDPSGSNLPRRFYRATEGP